MRLLSLTFLSGPLGIASGRYSLSIVQTICILGKPKKKEKGDTDSSINMHDSRSRNFSLKKVDALHEAETDEQFIDLLSSHFIYLTNFFASYRGCYNTSYKCGENLYIYILPPQLVSCYY